MVASMRRLANTGPHLTFARAVILTSSKLGFLADQEPKLVTLGALAKRYFPEDPSTALFKVRQADDIANLSFIAGRTNRQISDKPPIEYFPKMVEKSGKAAFASQCIPMEDTYLGTDLTNRS